MSKSCILSNCLVTSSVGTGEGVLFVMENILTLPSAFEWEDYYFN